MTARQAPARSDRLYVGAYLDRLDEIARTMERRWGIGRLPLLVDPELRLRFDRQREKLDQAIAADKAHAIAIQAEGMCRAWQALDAAATAAGAEPLAPMVWECHLPTSGKVVAIVRTSAEARRVAQDREVWSLDEVALLIERMGDDVRQVKATFSGAELVEVRDRLTSQALDDEIPAAFLGRDSDHFRAPRRESEERTCAEVVRELDGPAVAVSTTKYRFERAAGIAGLSEPLSSNQRLGRK